MVVSGVKGWNLFPSASLFLANFFISGIDGDCGNSEKYVQCHQNDVYLAKSSVKD